MKFISTRAQSAPVSLSEAVRRGAAPDGGLYLPERLPTLDISAWPVDAPLAEFAAAMLAPLFAGDRLAAELSEITREAFDFPVPIVTPDAAKPELRALELFHGPTGAFKDFGARFLIGCLERMGDPADPLNVLAATSGDTGGAVGCAAEGRAAVRATILYPRGRVSAFQELQLTCWDAPVRALEVQGDFDDCQRLVKAAFADVGLSRAHNLTSANSINIGRLLPQMAYLAHAALRMLTETGERPGMIIPTGNLGHGFAAVYARAMGAPIGPIVAVTNANRALAEWAAGADYAPRAAIATIANAMDVGAPSNFERLIHLSPELRPLRVELVEDKAIRSRIVAEHRSSGYIWCPHSATAAEAFDRLPADVRQARPWLAAATAHPFKFADVLEPILGTSVAAPPALQAIIGRPVEKTCIAATDLALAAALGERVAA